VRSKAETPYKSRRVELTMFDSDSEGHRFESCRAYSKEQPPKPVEIRASGVFLCLGVRPVTYDEIDDLRLFLASWRLFGCQNGCQNF
jgi:hypothetical protein